MDPCYIKFQVSTCNTKFAEPLTGLLPFLYASCRNLFLVKRQGYQLAG